MSVYTLVCLILGVSTLQTVQPWEDSYTNQCDPRRSYIWRVIQTKGESLCKGPEVGVCLAHLRYSEQSETGGQWQEVRLER